MKPICADGLLTVLLFMNGVSFTPTSTSRSYCLPNSSNSLRIHGSDTSGGLVSFETSAALMIICISSSYDHHTTLCVYSDHTTGRSGVVVSALVSINEVNLRRARLVLRGVTVSGFNSLCPTFISVCNQPANQGQLSRPSLWGR